MPKKFKNRGKVEKNILITQYFERKTQSNSITTESNNSVTNLNKRSENIDFYETCLLEKIDVCDTKKNCHAEKDNLRQKHDLLTQKLTKIRKAYSVCLKICEKKDNKMKKLKEKLHLLKSVNSDVNLQITSSSNEPKTPQPKAKKVLFEEYKGVFSDEQLATLRSINKNPRGDSTFVLNSVRFCYWDDMGKLEHKSLKGKNNGKEAISPTKQCRLKSLYQDRLDDLELIPEEKSVRENKFERHVHAAIMNINTGMKKASENKKIIHVVEEKK